MNNSASTSRTKITWYLVNPRTTSSVKQIKERSSYFCNMRQDISSAWFWEIVPRNGKAFRVEGSYFNKAQCRNVGKKFANMVGIEWRE